MTTWFLYVSFSFPFSFLFFPFSSPPFFGGGGGQARRASPLDTRLHMLMKLEQNCIVQTTQILSFLKKKRVI